MDDNIYLELEDFKLLLKQKGNGFIYSSERFSISRFDEVIIDKFKSFLPKAKTIIIYFKVNPDELLKSIQNCMEKLYDIADKDANIIFSLDNIKDMPIDEFEVTIILSGIENETI